MTDDGGGGFGDGGGDFEDGGGVSVVPGMFVT